MADHRRDCLHALARIDNLAAQTVRDIAHANSAEDAEKLCERLDHLDTGMVLLRARLESLSSNDGVI